MQSVWGCLHLLMKLQTHMHKHFSHHMSGLSTSHLARVWSTTALTRCNDTTCLTASLEPEDKVEWLEIATKTRAWRGDKRETEHERMHRHTIALLLCVPVDLNFHFFIIIISLPWFFLHQRLNQFGDQTSYLITFMMSLDHSNQRRHINCGDLGDHCQEIQWIKYFNPLLQERGKKIPD